MELRWLTAFVAVAEELNYRRAAERLFVAQPAISQQIMNLEKDLGVRLFDRNNRSVRLTDAGEAFLTPCRQALTVIENAGLLARNAGTGEYGRIRIGFNAGFTTDHLVTLVEVLRRDHPNLELTMDTSRRTPDILKMIRDEELDIGLVGGPANGPGLEQAEDLDDAARRRAGRVAPVRAVCCGAGRSARRRTPRPAANRYRAGRSDHWSRVRWNGPA